MKLIGTVCCIILLIIGFMLMVGSSLCSLIFLYAIRRELLNILNNPSQVMIVIGPFLLAFIPGYFLFKAGMIPFRKKEDISASVDDKPENR